jgi:hypothetical protein
MWLKRAKYILTTLGLLSFLIVSLFVAIAFVYEEEIKKQAVEELNAHLTSKVEVGKIELTALDQFPNISLKFKNVFIKDVKSNDQNDTLIYSEKLYFNFNFIDILKGNYEVKNVFFDNTTINIHVDESGKENYLIWISDSSNNNAVNFSLEKVVFNDLNFNYTNQLNEQYYKFHSPDIALNGDFYRSNYSLAIEGDVDVLNFTSNEITYLKNKQTNLDLNLKVDLKTMNYQFNNSSLFIEGMPFQISGNYILSDQPVINLNIIGNNIQIGQVFRAFPIKMLKAISTYNAKGKFEFEASIIGELSNFKKPFISANFAVNNGSIVELKSNTELASVFLVGSYSSKIKKEKERLVISNFNGILGNEKCNGSFEISNFNNPNIKGTLNSNFPLQQLLKFSSLQWGEIDGVLNSVLKFEFSYNKNSENYNLKNLEGLFVLNDFSLINSDENIFLKNVKGEFVTSGEQLRGTKIKGVFNDAKLVSDLNLLNFKKLITFETKVPKVKGQIYLDELFIDPFLGSNGNAPKPFYIQDSINLDLLVEVKKMTYNSFDSKNVKGRLLINNGNLNFKNVSLDGNKGNYQFDLAISRETQSDYQLLIQGQAHDIAISNFFSEFENFGQDYLTANHLKGKTSVELNLKIPFDNSLKFNENEIQATANISIKNGELINHESVLAMDSYLNESNLAKTFVDVNKLSKNLRHIYFSELTNTIEITNGKIKIPKMEISSNVLDFKLSGVHFFNDSIDYNVAFRLKDVLNQKKQKIEHIEVKDDQVGRMIFVRMHGTSENPIFELDRASKKQQNKENKTKEKQEIKTLLKDEFGVFSKDSTLKINTIKDTTVFELEWEEETGINETKPEKIKEDKPSKKDGKLNKWLKKIGVEEAKEEEVIFEIDQ